MFTMGGPDERIQDAKEEQGEQSLYCETEKLKDSWVMENSDPWRELNGVGMKGRVA